MGNPGFGIHCHPLDSVNPRFIWRTPLVNPLDSFGLMYSDFIKWANKNLDSGFVFFAARIAHVGWSGGWSVGLPPSVTVLRARANFGSTLCDGAEMRLLLARVWLCRHLID